MKLLGAIKQISNTTLRRAGKSAGRSLHITTAACLSNVVLGTGKLVVGVCTLSLFTCVCALYTFGIVTAKCFALAGIVKEENTKQQYRCYKISGLILILASTMYIVYSMGLFLSPVNSSYHMYAALLIATFTFAELFFNIKGVITERHNPSPLIHAIKMINLASSMVCLVLTQAAILSFADTQVSSHSSVNGFMGILMGSAAALLGIYMIIRITRIQRGKNYAAHFYRLKKLMRAERLYVKMKPVTFAESDGQISKLYVKLIKGHSNMEELCRKAEDNLGFKLQIAKKGEIFHD